MRLWSDRFSVLSEAANHTRHRRGPSGWQLHHGPRASTLCQLAEQLCDRGPLDKLVLRGNPIHRRNGSIDSSNPTEIGPVEAFSRIRVPCEARRQEAGLHRRSQ